MFSWDSVTTIRSRVRRVLRLERLVAEVLGTNNAPDASVEFLALVSRCYIYDFQPECVAVCRSAMEAAFREKVSDNQCQQANQRRQHFGFDLAARIEAAFDPRNGLLDLQAQKDVKDAATRVRLRGKKTLHEQPDLTKDVLGTVRDTLCAINALSQLPNAL